MSGSVGGSQLTEMIPSDMIRGHHIDRGGFLTRQVTMRELLVDPVFRQWMTRKPESHALRVRWRLYVQREEGGPWSKKDVESYVEGYKLLAKNFKRWHD